MKPVLLLDVDGVINVYAASVSSHHLEAEFFEGLFYVRIPIGMGVRLRTLAEHYEIVWCTAWEEKARQFGDRLSVPELATAPYVRWERASLCDATWKIRDVRHYVGENLAGRPVAWVDDDLGGDADQWALFRSADGAPTLCVKTNPSKGLTQEVCGLLVDFALAHGRQEAA